MIPADIPLWLMPLLLIYGRVQACLLAMPGTGERLLPIRVRAALGMALTPLSPLLSGRWGR